jgi:hypothetical protein
MQLCKEQFVGSAVRDIFRAIHEQKWLSVEYRNKSGNTTHYWIGVNRIDPVRRSLDVDSLHLGTKETKRLPTIYLDGVTAASVLEGTYHRTPPDLLQAIEEDERYEKVFGSVPNLRILDYYYDCVRLNETPFAREFSLLPRIDADSFQHGAVQLDDEQFGAVVRLMQADVKSAGPSRQVGTNKRIALNYLCLHMQKGLYVMAYRELRLDVRRRVLAIGRTVRLNHEFRVVSGRAGEVESIRCFLDDAELPLLEHFDQNAEQIKDCIAERCGASVQVDDEPHVFVLERFTPSYLQKEYDAIARMEREGKLGYPMRAFFGNLVRRPRRTKEWPLSLYRDNANLDQLLVVNQAIKYPLTYVQGPPGTGKTSTIENAIVNAFCNGKTVLFASYNNHPVDGVFHDLAGMRLGQDTIPFPILRLGNRKRMEEALDYMRELYEATKDLTLSRRAPRFEKPDDKSKSERLSQLLAEYEERVELEERRSCVEMLVSSNHNLNFATQLQGRQLAQIDARLGELRQASELDREARELTEGNRDSLLRFLMVASLYRVKRLGQPRFADLLDIVTSQDNEDEVVEESDERDRADEKQPTRVERFINYLSNSANAKALLGIFPVVATTCVSACRIGSPEPLFDITIIDEASQCDAATGLVPILRGQNLMLVGDPQQLNPVITVDRADSDSLRSSYGIAREYDYARSSLYKTFLACDSVSNEILLHAHYRCDERIITFNNKKYYGGHLRIMSGRRLPVALEYLRIERDPSAVKNTAPAEADAVVDYARAHPDQQIGVITPFSNQRQVIDEALRQARLTNATCGTVHSFQGDEKDVVLFSLALTDRTRDGTYRWLCDNRELINVATSRARDKLVIVACDAQVEPLHAATQGIDDLYELVQYVKSTGRSVVTPRKATSRALGVKPYSTHTETAFLESLSHALDNIFLAGTRHVVRREVPIAQVFDEDDARESLFYSGRFDFVVYEVQAGQAEAPVLAIELDGKEHLSDAVVARRDRTKEDICRRHGFELIRVENSYARRYLHIKEILVDYFSHV